MVEDGVGFNHIINHIALGDLKVKVVAVNKQFVITFRTSQLHRRVAHFSFSYWKMRKAMRRNKCRPDIAIHTHSSYSLIVKWLHLWQLRVEIKIDCIAVFRVPHCWSSVKGGAHACFVTAPDICASTKCMSVYGNVICDGILFAFYMGLSHMCSIPKTTHLFGSELFWGRKVFTIVVAKVVVAHYGDRLQGKTPYNIQHKSLNISSNQKPPN